MQRGLNDCLCVSLNGRLYVDWGRPSIAPEELLRALLLQVLYRIRSERILKEQWSTTRCSARLWD
jgi:transposase